MHARLYTLLRLAAAARALLGSLLVFGLAGRAQADEWSVERGLEDLRVLVATTRSAWAYHDDKREHFGVDLERLEADAAARIRAAAGWPEAVGAIQELVAALQDGHAGLVWDDPTAPTPARPGVTPHALVPTREGVAYDGAIVESWGGRPLEEVLVERERRTCASTPGMRRRVVVAGLELGTWGEEVRLRVRAAGEAPRERVVTLGARVTPPRAPIEARWLEPGVAYVRLSTFWAEHPVLGGPRPALERIGAAFREHADARALVLDLRGNMGGTDLLGERVALHLLPGAFVYFGLDTRWSDELLALPEFAASRPFVGAERGFLAKSEHRPERPAGLEPFLGPVWVLLDELCFSTTDNLLACLRDVGGERFRFVGRPSGAGTGAPRQLVTLPHSKAALTLTVMRVTSPAGQVIEGRGTLPTTEVRWTLADLVAGRDPDLEVALAEARAALAEAR